MSAKLASKQARLEEFFRRLLAAPAVKDAASAFQLMSSILNEVEDEMTDVPFDPEKWQQDGRMYPPQRDSAFDVEGHADVIRYRSRLHHTFISSWGAIEIRSIHQEVLVEKPGEDGRRVWG